MRYKNKDAQSPKMNISPALKDKLSHQLSQTVHGHCRPESSLSEMIKHIESELADALKTEQSMGRNLHRLVAATEKLTKEVREKKEQDMIDNTKLDASATRLEAAVQGLINALPGNSVPSTADTVVAAFQGRVDGASAAAEAAIATGSAGTPPTP